MPESKCGPTYHILKYVKITLDLFSPLTVMNSPSSGPGKAGWNSEPPIPWCPALEHEGSGQAEAWPLSLPVSDSIPQAAAPWSWCRQHSTPLRAWTKGRVLSVLCKWSGTAGQATRGCPEHRLKGGAEALFHHLWGGTEPEEGHRAGLWFPDLSAH